MKARRVISSKKMMENQSIKESKARSELVVFKKIIMTVEGSVGMLRRSVESFILSYNQRKISRKGGPQHD